MKWILTYLSIISSICLDLLDCACSDKFNKYKSNIVSPVLLVVKEDTLPGCDSSNPLCAVSCSGDFNLVAQGSGSDAFLTTAFFDSVTWTGEANSTEVDIGSTATTLGCLVGLRCTPYVDAKGVEHSSKCTVTDKGATCNEDRLQPLCTCSGDYVGDYCGTTRAAEELAAAYLGVVFGKMKEVLALGRSEDSMMTDLLPTIYAIIPPPVRQHFSWTVEEMFDSVAYEWDELNIRDVFTRIFDETFGNCYTFNYSNDTNNDAGLFHVRYAGQYRDFAAMLKFEPAETVAWVSCAAMNIYIHAPGTPFKQGLRYSMKAGSSDILALTKTIAKLIDNCLGSVDELNQNYYETGGYTTEGCFNACYQDKVEKECGCMDARYRKGPNATSCTFKDDECVKNVTTKFGEPSGWPDCVCPQACFQEYYSMTATRGDLPIKGPSCTNLTHGCKEANDQWGRISIYMESLEAEIFVEEPKNSLSSLLSQCGGLLGVCLGLSAVGLIEILLLCGKLGLIGCKRL